MIAGDVKVIKFCIHCNEVGANTCDWLPIIYQTPEFGAVAVLPLIAREGIFFSLLAREQESCRRKKKKEGKKRNITSVFPYVTRKPL